MRDFGPGSAASVRPTKSSGHPDRALSSRLAGRPAANAAQRHGVEASAQRSALAGYCRARSYLAREGNGNWQREVQDHAMVIVSFVYDSTSSTCLIFLLGLARPPSACRK
jgi:hypothetical protein